MPTHVFGYGTLRRGEVNHHLLADSRFCGEHITLPKYRILHLGSYPGVVEGGSTAIIGELYRVDREQFVRLDRLKAYPSLFTRKVTPYPHGPGVDLPLPWEQGQPPCDSFRRLDLGGETQGGRFHSIGR